MSGNNPHLLRQDGVIIGNVEDKNNLKNPISRRLVNGFDTALFELIRGADPQSIHEVGCGEGRLLEKIHEIYDIPLKGTDLSTKIIEELARNSPANVIYKNKSIYDLSPKEDTADLVICCEVLEHLDDPQKGVLKLKELGARTYILSVPKEPVWRVLNMTRGKYLSDFGNTPGHLNHWSSGGFVRFLDSFGFCISDIRKPFPWTMVVGHFK